MAAAIQAVRDQHVSQRQACKTFCVPRCTLQSRVSGKVDIGAKAGRRTVMPPESEEKLVDYAVNRAAMGIGFGRQQFLGYAAKFAQKHHLKFKSGIPSLRWWRGMKKRHNRITLRQPEGTAAVRHQCMEKSKILKYFDTVKSVLKENELWDKPHLIWNMDETGLQLDHRPGKVIATKGSRYLHARTSGNRETITIIAAINAAGGTMPPHVIVKGKTRRSLNSFQLDDAPVGTTWSWSDTGWTKQGIALLWFTKSFLPAIGHERPQVLILDGHDSHNFLELIDTAIENNISIIELPAHTSNWLQPCDRTVFGPFKVAYRNACDELMSMFPGTLVSRSTFCGLLKRAWEEAVTSANIQSGFRACGVYPFSPDSIPQEAFLHNQLYASTTSSGADNVLPVTGEPITEEAPQGTPVSLNLSDVSEDPQPVASSVTVSLTPTAPQITLELFESQLSSEQLQCYRFCYGKYDITTDNTYMTWKQLKLLCESESSEVLGAADSRVDSDISNISLGDISLSDLLVDGTEASEILNQSVLLDITNHIEQQIPANDGDGQCPNPCGSELVNELKENSSNPGTSEESTTRNNENEQNLMQRSELTSTPVSLNLSDTLVTQNDVQNQFPLQNTSFPGDDDEDVLPYPLPVMRKKKTTTKQKYFLLTSKEARESKMKEVQDKIAREESKKARELARAQKRQQKTKTAEERETRKVQLIGVKRKRSKKIQEHKVKKKRAVKDKDITPCSTCYIIYCDSSDQSWIQCQNCHSWYHNACQGLDEQGPDTFACISCEDAS